jgi:hypothetical protein
MRGAIPPFSQYVFMAWRLVKHRTTFPECRFLMQDCYNKISRVRVTESFVMCKKFLLRSSLCNFLPYFVTFSYVFITSLPLCSEVLPLMNKDELKLPQR